MFKCEVNLDTVGVVGSIPIARTIKTSEIHGNTGKIEADESEKISEESPENPEIRQKVPENSFLVRVSSGRKTWPASNPAKGSKARKIRAADGTVIVVSDEDYLHLSTIRWFVRTRHGLSYADSHKHGLMHRYILKPPSGVAIDHINGNGLDNRRENLRLCTQGENARNRQKRKPGTSAFKGVSRRPNKKWRAAIYTQGKHYDLGEYLSEIEAARAYDTAARKLHGEFARTNFPKESP